MSLRNWGRHTSDAGAKTKSSKRGPRFVMAAPRCLAQKGEGVFELPTLPEDETDGVVRVRVVLVQRGDQRVVAERVVESVKVVEECRPRPQSGEVGPFVFEQQREIGDGRERTAARP